MYAAESARCYQAAAVKTAPPAQLIQMLFDGALRFMATATAGFNEPELSKRIEKIHLNLVKAQNILRELQTSLDLEKGGEFAQRMFALYDFMIAQLNEANLRKDPQPIQTVADLLGQLRDAWAQMLGATKGEAA